jgi:hypothetical protein
MLGVAQTRRFGMQNEFAQLPNAPRFRPTIRGFAACFQIDSATTGQRHYAAACSCSELALASASKSSPTA